MQHFTEENLIFKCVYTIREHWPYPDIDGKEIKWDGDQMAEQTLYADLNIRQFIGLVIEYDLTECNDTLGIQIETGHLIPAVNFTDHYESNSCYVSVYTDELLKSALAESEEPTEQPVIDRNGIRSEKIGYAHTDRWQSLVQCLGEVIFSDGEPEQDIDELVSEMVRKLNQIMFNPCDRKRKD